MKDSQKMIKVWRKWEAEINDLGIDLAVCSAMNEWHEQQVKKLNLHIVMKSVCEHPHVFGSDGLCECPDCGARNY